VTQIPEQTTTSLQAVPAATPSITIGAPGPGARWIIDRIRARVVSNGGGAYAPNIQLTDALAGLVFVWQLACPAAAAGAITSDEIDIDNLEKPINVAQAVNYSAALPAGIVGTLSVTYRLVS
jgi:hypothetical protein